MFPANSWLWFVGLLLAAFLIGARLVQTAAFHDLLVPIVGSAKSVSGADRQSDSVGAAGGSRPSRSNVYEVGLSLQEVW